MTCLKTKLISQCFLAYSYRNVESYTKKERYKYIMKKPLIVLSASILLSGLLLTACGGMDDGNKSSSSGTTSSSVQSTSNSSYSSNNSSSSSSSSSSNSSSASSSSSASNSSSGGESSNSTPLTQYSLTYNADSDHPSTTVKFYSFAYGSDDTEITTAAAGTRVKVVVNSSEQVAGVKYNGKDATDSSGNYFFTMPAKDVTITVSYVQASSTQFTLGPARDEKGTQLDFYAGSENGAQISSANEGDKIYVNIWNADDAIRSTITGISIDGVSVTHEDGYWYSFTMPGSNVSVKVNYADGSSISTAHTISPDMDSADENGTYFTFYSDATMTQTTNNAEAGVIIYVNAYNENKTVAGLTSDVNGVEFTYVNGIWKFTMPNADITVKSIIQSASSAHALSTVEDGKGTDVTFMDASQNQISSATSGETVFINLWNEDETITGVSFEGITFTPVTGANNTWSFIMPDKDVSITIVYETAATSHSLSFKADANHSENSVMFMKSIEDAGSMTGQGLTTATTGEEILVYVVVTDEASYNGVTAEGVTFTPDTTYPTMVFHFIMPDNDVEVAINYLTSPASTSHSLSYDASSVAADTTVYFLKDLDFSNTPVSLTSATEGDDLYFVISGDCTKLENVTSDVESLILTKDTQNSGEYMAIYSFKMPSSDVTMTLHYASSVDYSAIAGTYTDSNKNTMVLNSDGSGTWEGESFTFTYNSSDNTGKISAFGQFDAKDNGFVVNSDGTISVSISDESQEKSYSAKMTKVTTPSATSYNLTATADSKHSDTVVTFGTDSANVVGTAITSASAGDTVYVQVSLSYDDSQSYDISLTSNVDSVTFTKSNSTDNIWSFTMPDSDLTVSVAYQAKPISLEFNYDLVHTDTKVKFYSSSDTSESNEIREALPGSTAYVKVTLNEADSKYSKIELDAKDVDSWNSVSDGVWSFTVPDSNVGLRISYTSPIGTFENSTKGVSLTLNSNGTGNLNGYSITFSYDKTTMKGKIVDREETYDFKLIGKGDNMELDTANGLVTLDRK